MTFITQLVTVKNESLVSGSTWIYLFDWALSLVLSIAFIFYFNRLVGAVLTWFFRWLLWKSDKVSIHIESFKLSILGGRILMKNVTIVNKDYSVSVLNANLEWRYWLFSLPRLSAFYYDKGATGEDELDVKGMHNENHIPKVVLELNGFEIFMYNRTMAFDQIMDLLNNFSKDDESGADVSLDEKDSQSNSTPYSSEMGSNEFNEPTLRFRNGKSDTFVSSASVASKHNEVPEYIQQSRIKYLLTLLPLKLRIKTGAIVMGNASTPSIVVASYKTASGFIDISKSPCELDHYRFVQDLTFDTFQVSMKPNIEYDSNKFLTHSADYEAVIARDHEQHNSTKRYKNWFKFQATTDKILRAYQKVQQKLRRRKNAPMDTDIYKEKWRGLRRYIGDQSDDPNFLDLIITDEQYAKYSLILDSGSTRIVYYFDKTGKIPLKSRSTLEKPPAYPPPVHGVEVHLSLATIHYGPWADKQRVPLQNAFFPSLSRDSVPTVVKDIPGSQRQYAGFQVTTHVKDEVILRIPTREPSKNKDLLKQMNNPHPNHMPRTQPEEPVPDADDSSTSSTHKLSRPFGWLEIKLGPTSTISFFTSYIAKPKIGWSNTLTAAFVKPEVRTSVNHDILFIADSHTIDADIGYPLTWNGKCEWLFTQKSDNARVFFLREHTLLFSDIFTDFGSGEPTPYEFFRPFIYSIDWELMNYKLYLNVNDANIISNPLDFNVNKFISFQGDSLKLNLEIPLFGDFAKTTTISYNMETSFFNLVLDTPPWHTSHAFAKDSKVVGRSNTFTITGSYTFFTNVEIQTSNYIEIRCLGEYVTLKFYGPLIKYLFLIRENYFGDHIHFKTFEEYTCEQSYMQETGGSDTASTLGSEPDVDYYKILKTENDVDVLFSFSVRHGLIILPCNLFDSKSHIGLTFNSLDTDIRFTNYYMDLQADLSHITGILVQDNKLDEMDSIYNIPAYKEMFFGGGAKDLTIDGLSIHAHRMFGLPPEELTYFCKWDLEAGDIAIDCKPIFLSSLVTSIRNIAFGFGDVENGLHLEVPIVFDALNFSFKCCSIIIKVHLETPKNTLFLIDLGRILLSYNDIANDRYSDRATFSLPDITVKILQEDRILAFVHTSLVFNNICQKKNMLEHRRQQQRHIKVSDAPYHRSPFLLFSENRDESYYEGYGCFLSPLTLPDANPPLTHRYGKVLNDDYWDSTSEESQSTFGEDNVHRATFAAYENDDFCPSYPVDPKYEYDSCILELGNTQIIASPRALEAVASLMIESKDFSLDVLMDYLHLELIVRLKECVEKLYNVRNLRLVCHELTVRLGTFEPANNVDILSVYAKLPHICLTLSDSSVAFSMKQERIGQKNDIDVTTEIKAALHLKEIKVQFQASNETPANALTIADFEFWVSIPQDEEAIISSTVHEIDFDIHTDSLDDSVHFLTTMIDSAEPGILKFKKLSQKSTELAFAELVYKLVTASSEHSIDHDPEVLTKPANLLRSKTEHVRFFDTWKMITRLRHVLDHMPQSWLDEQNARFQASEWQFTRRAYTEVTDIFARWRSWEANTEQRKIFYNFVFSSIVTQDEEKEKDIKCRVDLTELSIKISDPTAEYDYLNLQSYRLSVAVSNSLSLVGIPRGMTSPESSLNLVIVSNLASYKCKVSVVTMNFVSKLLQKVDAMTPGYRPTSKEVSKEPPKVGKTKNYRFSVVSNVISFQQILFLPTCYFELSALETLTTFEGSLFKDLLPFTLANRSSAYDFSIWAKDQRQVHAVMSDLHLVVANGDDFKTGSKIADLTLGKLSFKVLDKDDNIISNIKDFVSTDIEYLKSLIGQENKPEVVLTSSQSVRSSKESAISLDTLFEFSISIRVREFLWVLELLHPLKLHGAMYDSQLSVENVGGTILLESLIQKIDFNANIRKSVLMEIQYSQLNSNLKFAPSYDLYLLSGTIGVGYAKLFSPSLVPAVESVALNKINLEQKLDRWEELSNLFDTPGEHSPTADVESTLGVMDKLAFKGKITIDYVGLSTFVEKTKYSFEVENTSFGMYNVASAAQADTGAIHQIVPAYGDLSIPTARLYVVDRSIPVGLSTIVDVNLSVKILHSNGGLEPLQSLQVESQFCRVCLSPQVLFKLVNLLDVARHSLSRIPLSKKSKDVDALSKPATLELKPKKSSASFLNKFSSAHLLAYNFCCGWIFEESSKDYPGVIIGAERFFAIAEETMGKFTLMEAYLCVANGSRSSNFYSMQSERSNCNRAFLPRMQLIYTTEKKEDSKSMSIIIKGDELDVQFLSTSVVIIENVSKSGSSVQKFFNTRAAKNAAIHVEDIIDIGTPKQDEPKKDFKLVFDSIELRASFAGSTVEFSKLNDDNATTPPKLLLHSPAVSIAAKYKHQKMSLKKHVVEAEVLTSSSDNVLLSTCVPVIADFAEGIKRMLHSNEVNGGINAVNTNSSTTSDTPEHSKGADFDNLLKDFDIHFGLRIEKQALTLSCAPMAKVAAIVGMDGIYVQVNTGTKDVPSIVLTALFDSISASLQHVYSRDVSGSISIRKTILTSSFEFGEVPTVLSSGSVLDVVGYINVKQYQDLDLFKDIWFPKQYAELYSSFLTKRDSVVDIAHKSELASNKNISARFKEVSTSYALPWVVTVIVSNIKLEVDFGQSLGNFKLHLGKLWAVSKKSTDWAQDLKIGFDSICLTSEGRLGGSLDVKNANLHTAIGWKLDTGETLDVPLILISAGVETLQAKASFDFHVFAIAHIEGLSIDVFNQKSEITVSKDHLFVTANLETAEIYVTSLTASNCFDIWNTISRMIQDNKRSYKETLRDSSKDKGSARRSGSSADRSQTASTQILETVKKLEAKIQVISGRLILHVYPSSFDDSKVLVVQLDESKAYFQQNEFPSGISNDLEIQFNDLKVSLSATSSVSEDFIAQCSVNDFLDYARKARGGTIFVFPSFKISMRTFQNYEDNLIEYLYQSSFGGTVDVRWNLGSVNFIREMFAIHKKALSSRTEYKSSTDRVLLREDIFKKSETRNISRTTIEEEDPNGIIDQVLSETIVKVADESKYKYSPLAPPIIEAPQLKELGNATPPLEWFGLHRNKFPNVTHEVGIVSLQKLMHQVESQYSKLLGKA